MAWAWGNSETKTTKTVEAVPTVQEEHYVELFDPHSNEWLLNKFETYKHLRSGTTAYWSRKYQMYVLTRYDDVIFALNNPEIFSPKQGNLLCEQESRLVKTLGASDDITRNKIESIIRNAYSAENLDRVAVEFVKRCKELIKPVDNLNISEIIEDLSATVIAELINPPFKKDEVKQYITHIQKHYSGAISNESNDTGYNMFTALLLSMAGTLQIPSKGPGLYNEFVTDNPEKTKMIPALFEPAISGASSLTGALEILTLDLFRENKIDIILADKSLIPNLINESLRFYSSMGRFSRIVTQTVRLHGVDLEPGTRIALCLESANRDPNKFQDPDKFLLGRDSNGQVAIEQGVYASATLDITKKLMHIWVEQLLDLYGKYRVITENKDLQYTITSSGNDDMIYNICLTTDK